MASLFSELYTDFKEAIKTYTPKVDVDDLSFMRRLTRGMQIFQRNTEYIEAYNEVPYNETDSCFYVPDDMRRCILLKDVNDYTLLLHGMEQFACDVEKYTRGYVDSPRRASIRLDRSTQYGTDNPYTRDTTISSMTKNYLRLATIYGRKITIYPDNTDRLLYMWYIPDIHAISQNSTQWLEWFPYDTNFESMFTTSTLNPLLSPFEHGIMKFAVADYLQSQRAKNYLVYLNEFVADMQLALAKKPIYNKEMSSQYHFSPYS